MVGSNWWLAVNLNEGSYTRDTGKYNESGIDMFKTGWQEGSVGKERCLLAMPIT